MLKNLEIWITEKCNSRCLFCHWWKNSAENKDINPKELKNLLSRDEFKKVESAQISGGEPMMHSAPEKVARAIIKSLPRLKRVLIATNGSYHEKTAELFKNIRTYSDIKLKLCVSIEGDREVHEKIRGVDGYDNVSMTLKKCKAAIPELKTIILMTLTKYNCNFNSLEHIGNLANHVNSAFSFRLYYHSDTHHRADNDELAISDAQIKTVIDYTKKYFQNDPFLMAQAEYLATSKMPFMNKCLAGSLFVNIRADGGIYPCINSMRKIGDSKRGIYKDKIVDLGKYETCPCCDEACFYPMYNYRQLR